MLWEISEGRRVKPPLEIYRPGDLLPYTLRGISRKCALLLGQCTSSLALAISPISGSEVLVTRHRPRHFDFISCSARAAMVSIQVFDSEWHKLHFGVFRERVVLYVNCEPVGKLQP
jgi:hypothetical protein